METFAVLKYHLRLLGILKWDTSLRAKSMAVTANCIFPGIGIFFSLITSTFVLFEAQTKQEILVGTFFSISSIYLASWSILLVKNKAGIGKLLVDLDDLIQKRKTDKFN